MEYKNGIFYLQNLEEEKVSVLGVDATILYGVLVSMMNSRVELDLEDMRDAFFALGGAHFDEALNLLKENGFINPDTNDIYILHTQALAHEYHIGSFTFHFRFNSNESRKAFEGINNAPETRQLVARSAPTAFATYLPQPKLTAITITNDGTYHAPEGYDGFDIITVKTKPNEPWRLKDNDVCYVFMKAKFLRHYHKLVRGEEPPANLSEGARTLWNYLTSPSATHLMRLFAPRINSEMGLSAEEVEKAAAELHGYGFLFFANDIEGVKGYTYSLFTDHTISEAEWRDYERRITEEHDSYERAKRFVENKAATATTNWYDDYFRN